MRKTHLPVVRRVETENGSHIEPAADESWDELTMLRWKAAVVCVDGGFDPERIQIDPAQQGFKKRRWSWLKLGYVEFWEERPGYFAIQIDYGVAVFRFDQAYLYLTGVTEGAQAMRRSRDA